MTLPVIPAPPIALNGYADDGIVESKMNALVTEIENDDVGVGERDNNDLSGGDDNENNNGDNVDDGLHENNGDDDGGDGININGDLGDNDDGTNDNCDSVQHNGNVLKSMDTKTDGKCQNTCENVDQKHNASNISGRT